MKRTQPPTKHLMRDEDAKQIASARSRKARWSAREMRTARLKEIVNSIPGPPSPPQRR
jgi:hypothetical protein